MNAEDCSPSRSETYDTLALELASILDGETSMMARLASTACLLAQAFQPRFFWTGFYLIDPARPQELVVGPYQGTLGCLRIPVGKGVCGAAAKQGRTILVPDVHAFPGHIACDSRSQSEIVVPVFDRHGALYGVIDVDSTEPDAFDQTDAAGLEQIAALLVI